MTPPDHEFNTTPVCDNIMLQFPSVGTSDLSSPPLLKNAVLWWQLPATTSQSTWLTQTQEGQWESSPATPTESPTWFECSSLHWCIYPVCKDFSLNIGQLFLISPSTVQCTTPEIRTSLYYVILSSVPLVSRLKGFHSVSFTFKLRWSCFTCCVSATTTAGVQSWFQVAADWLHGLQYQNMGSRHGEVTPHPCNQNILIDHWSTFPGCSITSWSMLRPLACRYRQPVIS